MCARFFFQYFVQYYKMVYTKKLRAANRFCFGKKPGTVTPNNVRLVRANTHSVARTDGRNGR